MLMPGYSTTEVMVEMGQQAAPYIPFWRRIEPRCRNNNFAPGLKTASADPLWLIARQWQVGEFQGEDTGSPINVDFTTISQNITHAALGGSNRVNIKVDENSPPLEMLVEREYIELDCRASVRIGQQLERILNSETGIDVNNIIYHLRQKYKVIKPGPDDYESMDRATQRFLSVIAGRAINGKELMKAIGHTTEGDIQLPVGWSTWLGDDEAVVNHAIDKLLKWYVSIYGPLEALVPSQSPAWVHEDLEYTFKLHTSKAEGIRTTLIAPHYRNGELDWYTFRILKNSLRINPELKNHKRIPTRVSFPGMPHARWWAFEDNQVDFGNVEAATTDLAKLMIMNFSILYGDDWFIIPIQTKTNTITRIRDEKLTVTDVFGQPTEIHPARSTSENPWEIWQIFGMSYQDKPNEVGDFLYLPPTVRFGEESSPLEDVHFIRDEMANMVWGIEHIVPNGLGEPVQGFDAQSELHAREQEADLREKLARLLRLKEQLLQQLGGQATVQNELIVQTRESLQTKVKELEEQIKQLQADIAAAGLGPQPDTTTEEETGLPKYRLSTTVPDNWIPFVPVSISHDSPEVYLRQARMVRNEENQIPVEIKSMSRLLSAVNDLGELERLNEEAVPRAGQKVQMTRQRVRWVDGKTYVWVGRKVITGRGEGSSGLRFDIVKNRTDGI